MERPVPAVAPAPPEADLAELPAPRRPFRRLTFAVMLLTGVASLLLLAGLRGEVSYALDGGRPTDLGELSRAKLQAAQANTWIRAEGALSAKDVIGYQRPLEADSYRLARVEGTQNVWVELRVPEGADAARFIAPSSFVGRFFPVSVAGVRYGALPEAVAEAGRPPLPSDAWLLIDGEAPAGTRWALGLGVLLVAFAAFNLLGVMRLAQRVRDA
jgi:hypothetical protein